MDLTLFFRVAWRYRLLVLSGLIVAVLAAFFALVRVDPAGSPVLSLRGEGQYVSYTTIFVTQEGFPWGRLPTDDEEGGVDAARLAGLATLYTKLVDSDPVADLTKAVLPETGWSIESTVLLDDGGIAQALPLIRIAGLANTPALAELTAATVADSLMTYVSQRQQGAQIPQDERVVLQLIKGPDEAVTLAGRSFTFPIVIFLLLSMLSLAAPFLIDNIRRSAAALREQAPDRRAPVDPPVRGVRPRDPLDDDPFALSVEEDDERRRRIQELSER